MKKCHNCLINDQKYERRPKSKVTTLVKNKKNAYIYMKFTRYVSKYDIISLHNRRRGQCIFEARGLAFVYPRRIPSAPPPETTFRQLPGRPRHLKSLSTQKLLQFIEKMVIQWCDVFYVYDYT